MVHAAGATCRQEDRIPARKSEYPYAWKTKKLEALRDERPSSFRHTLKARLREEGYTEDTIDLILDAFRNSTTKTYSTYIRRWCEFCITKKLQVLNPSLPEVAAFLRELEKGGLGYSAINTARSALSAVLQPISGKQVGQHQTICWLTKGASERHPSGAKYPTFWDTNKVFVMFQRWGENGKLNLKQLSLKLAVLLLLVTSQRGQTILALDLDGLHQEENLVVFTLFKLLKSNRCGDRLSTVMLRGYPKDHRCVLKTLADYLDRVKELRPDYERQLLISFVYPHEGISRDTLAHWTL